MKKVTKSVPTTITDKEVKVIITNYLREFGISPNINGYNYIREAVFLSIMDKEMLEKIVKLLYPTVGEAYGTTVSRVERSIRHAIETAYDKGNKEAFEKHFGFTISHRKGAKPTNSEFIALLTDEIKLELGLA